MFTTLGYLYNQIHPVIVGTGPYDRWNRMYYAKPVKLHKGVNNPVKFKIRNQNQKDVDVTSSVFQLYITDARTNEEKLSRRLDIENATRGIISTVFTTEDLVEFDSLRYNYGIIMTDISGDEYPVYVDDNYSASGVIEVYSDAFPQQQKAAEPTVGAYTDGVAHTSVTEIDSNLDGIHTAAYYLDNFTGTVTVQAHLEDATNVSDEDYLTVRSDTYAAESGIVYVNFTGMFTTVRFKIERTDGSVTKILYKS